MNLLSILRFHIAGLTVCRGISILKPIPVVLRTGNRKDILASRRKSYFNYALYTEPWDARTTETIKQRIGLVRLQGKPQSTAVFTQ